VIDRELEAAEHAAARTQWSGLRAYGPVVRDVDGWTALGCAELPTHPWLNQVVGDGPGLAGALDALADAGVERAQVTVAGPVPDELVRRGFVAGRPLLRLVAPADGDVPVTAFRLEVVGADRAADVVAVALAGFGLGLPGWWPAPLGRPGWTQVVAYDGDEPVAVGGLHVAGRTGWVGAAATLPRARGRGAQSALLALRLRLAAEQGADRVSVKADRRTASLRNLERAGFLVSHEVVPWSGPPRG
jgi:GNAT superfamily N-acetyltransferase